MTFQQHVETFPLISSEGWKELEVFPGGFLGGAAVKNPPANAGDARDSGSIPPGGLITESGRSLGQEMATHSSILVWFPIQGRSYTLHGAHYPKKEKVGKNQKRNNFLIWQLHVNYHFSLPFVLSLLQLYHPLCEVGTTVRRGGCNEDFKKL